MRHALNMAHRALGSAAPNPAVGCVIVTESGEIAGRGCTQPKGRPHAEAVALKQAGEKARGATAYVTLEPCSHVGQTPACAKALIDAGIKRCVVACGDPFTKVNGAGISMLKEAGVIVKQHVCEPDAAEQLAGFFSVVLKKRPHITLKLATSKNGKIAAGEGQKTVLSNPISMRYAHLLRAQADAILVGAGTVWADNPRLNCRLPGREHENPKRYVLMGARGIPKNTAMLRDGFGDSVLINGAKTSLNEMVHDMARDGITRLLVEGGSEVAASLLTHGLVDTFIWVKTQHIIDEKGVDAIAENGLAQFSDASKWEATKTLSFLDDTATHFNAVR